MSTPATGVTGDDRLAVLLVDPRARGWMVGRSARALVIEG